MSNQPHQTVGMAGLFDDPDRLLRAAEKVRDAGFTRWDCHTPYPVHGLDDAMGIKPSIVPGVVWMGGFFGLIAAIGMTYHFSVLQYPIRIGGKALMSWQAFVPIYFELFVLFAALACMACVVVLGKLGRWHSPLHDSGIMPEITSHRFAVVLQAKDDAYSESTARSLLEAAGCEDIRPLIEYDEEDDALI